jgi:hypothetical protein
VRPVRQSQYVLPLETFAQIAEGNGSSFLGFNYKVEVDQPDQTILHRTLAMLPVLLREREGAPSGGARRPAAPMAA